MSATERIIFQPYVTGRGNSLVPGQAVLCRNPDEASAARREGLGRRSHRRSPYRPCFAGCGPAGDYGEPEYLADLGRAPDAA